jgi:hypothetical protein
LPANQGVVHIKLVDSVPLLNLKVDADDWEGKGAKALKSLVKKQILNAYLEYARRRGFGHGYFYAQPPEKGQPFIFSNWPSSMRRGGAGSKRHLLKFYDAMLALFLVGFPVSIVIRGRFYATCSSSTDPCRDPMWCMCRGGRSSARTPIASST